MCRMWRERSEYVPVGNGLSILPLLLHRGLECGLKIL